VAYSTNYNFRADINYAPERWEILLEPILGSTGGSRRINRPINISGTLRQKKDFVGRELSSKYSFNRNLCFRLIIKSSITKILSMNPKNMLIISMLMNPGEMF
jgi:hypothetical protein